MTLEEIDILKIDFYQKFVDNRNKTPQIYQHPYSVFQWVVKQIEQRECGSVNIQHVNKLVSGEIDNL